MELTTRHCMKLSLKWIKMLLTPEGKKEVNTYKNEDKKSDY